MTNERRGYLQIESARLNAGPPVICHSGGRLCATIFSLSSRVSSSKRSFVQNLLFLGPVINEPCRPSVYGIRRTRRFSIKYFGWLSCLIGVAPQRWYLYAVCATPLLSLCIDVFFSTFPRFSLTWTFDALFFRIFVYATLVLHTYRLFCLNRVESFYFRGYCWILILRGQDCIKEIEFHGIS